MKLRKLMDSDAKGMLEWMEDPEINSNFRFSAENISKESVAAFIGKAIVQWEEGTTLHYAIGDDNDNYMGTVSLKNIDKESSHAEYAISLRKCAQGKGLGEQATREVLKKAFEEWKLERVYLNVLSENLRAISLYEKMGFVFEGEFRNHLKIDGKRNSLKWYGMLREEYDTKLGKQEKKGDRG